LQFGGDNITCNMSHPINPSNSANQKQSTPPARKTEHSITIHGGKRTRTITVSGQRRAKPDYHKLSLALLEYVSKLPKDEVDRLRGRSEDDAA
jgi:hypothetical protein